MSRTWTIGEAAVATGLSADTLRYYERGGLLAAAVGRASSGHRRYTQADLDWIELITRLRATGMPVRDVRRYTELVRAGRGTEQQRLELLQTHRRNVLAQLNTINAHLTAIDTKIDTYRTALERDRLSA